MSAVGRASTVLKTLGGWFGKQLAAILNAPIQRFLNVKVGLGGIPAVAGAGEASRRPWRRIRTPAAATASIPLRNLDARAIEVKIRDMLGESGA